MAEDVIFNDEEDLEEPSEDPLFSEEEKDDVERSQSSVYPEAQVDTVTVPDLIC